MKSYRYKISREEDQITKIWDAFVNHIVSIYFSGASELLNQQTLAFEYESFRNCCSV